MKQRLTEERPSSGISKHEHSWQILEKHSDGTMTLVCKVEGCGATKKVQSPKLEETKSGKSLLLG